MSANLAQNTGDALSFCMSPRVEQSPESGGQSLIGTHHFFCFVLQHGDHTPDSVHAVSLRFQFRNTAYFANDGFQSFGLRRCQDQAHELIEADALIFFFQHVFRIQSKSQDSATRIAAFDLSLLDLSSDFTK